MLRAIRLATSSYTSGRTVRFLESALEVEEMVVVVETLLGSDELMPVPSAFARGAADGELGGQPALQRRCRKKTSM